MPFPGPGEMKDDPAFRVLVDSTDISGRPLVVLGAQSTFDELRQDLTPRLEDYGWELTRSDVQAIPQEDLLRAEKDDRCIYYWNMSPGSYAPGMRNEAIRENPRFDEQARQYVTLFRVFISDCG